VLTALGGEAAAQQIGPSAPVAMTKFSVASESFTTAQAFSIHQTEVYLQPTGHPTTKPRLRLLDADNSELWVSAEFEPMSGWNVLMLPDVSLTQGGRYRLVLDDSNSDPNNAWSAAASGDSVASYGSSAAEAQLSPDRKGDNDLSEEAVGGPSSTAQIHAFNSSANDSLLAGFRSPFELLTIVGAGSGPPTDLSLRYWDGVAWSTLSSAVVQVGLNSFRLSWTAPTDWQPSDEYGASAFWIRMSSASALTIQHLSRMAQALDPVLAAHSESRVALVGRFRAVHDSLDFVSIDTSNPEGDTPVAAERETSPLRQQSAMTGLLARVGARYAGRWRDPLVAGGIIVGVRGLTQADSDYLASQSESARRHIRLQEKPYTVAELDGFAEGASAAAASHPGEYSGESIEVDYAGSMVRAHFVTATSPVIADVSASGPPNVVVADILDARGVALNADRESVPYVSGLHLYMHSSFEDTQCTSNFEYITPDNSYRYSTAGHCADGSAIVPYTVKVGSTQVGTTVGTNGWLIDDGAWQAADLVAMRREGGLASTPSIHIYPGKNRTVENVFPRDLLASGVTVCLSGRLETGGHCGPITRKISRLQNVDYDYDRGWKDVWCFNPDGMATVPSGDSGAPIYVKPDDDSPSTPDTERYGFAAGVLVARPFDRVEEGCFQSVDAIRETLGYRVWVQGLVPIPYRVLPCGC
jgi:hypothetical protein